MEDRSLGMRKAAGSIPADSIATSYYGQIEFKSANESCILIEIFKRKSKFLLLYLDRGKKKKRGNFSISSCLVQHQTFSIKLPSLRKKEKELKIIPFPR